MAVVAAAPLDFGVQPSWAGNFAQFAALAAAAISAGVSSGGVRTYS